MIFSSDSLASVIRDSDLASSPNYVGAGGAIKLAADAALEAVQGFPGLSLKTFSMKKKPVYVVEDIPSLVVLRRLNGAIAQAANIRMSDRDTIIRRLISVLREGVRHRIYKFDVRSFFETVDIGHLRTALKDDTRVPRVASIVLEHFFDKVSVQGISGIPRGVPLSATLAEYALRAFDEAISQSANVYYYARYVDDIVIVTGARENTGAFARFVRAQLPPGLEFNPAKTRVVELPADRKGTGTTVLGSFDFLGYGFVLYDTVRKNRILLRPIDVTIAAKKIARIKSRICRSFLAFLLDGNLPSLHRRLQMLSGNFNVRDQLTGRTRNVGLFCNYRRITADDSLTQLDTLLRSIVLGTRSRLATRVRGIASEPERKRLLVHGFQKSFRARTFYNFSAAELGTLKRCWQHA